MTTINIENSCKSIKPQPRRGEWYKNREGDVYIVVSLNNAHGLLNIRTNNTYASIVHSDKLDDRIFGLFPHYFTLLENVNISYLTAS